VKIENLKNKAATWSFDNFNGQRDRTTTQKKYYRYDATGIVSAARKYRAGRDVVLFTVRPVPSTRKIKKYIEEVMKMF
jgi:hypothetical protein